MRISLRGEENGISQCMKFQKFTVLSNYFEFEVVWSDFTVFACKIARKTYFNVQMQKYTVLFHPTIHLWGRGDPNRVPSCRNGTFFVAPFTKYKGKNMFQTPYYRDSSYSAHPEEQILVFDQEELVSGFFRQRQSYSTHKRGPTPNLQPSTTRLKKSLFICLFGKDSLL